jgi:Cdc6-like AAA superfamily ATPase
VLYISGVPGTGKTASVLSVVKQMQKSATSKDQQFDFAYINSMKLNTPTDLYVDLMNKMWIHKRKFKADKPQEKLTEYFTTLDKNRPVTVLLVDEIDYLVNKSQAVVYQLFDWPLLASSKLILLTISNTMDLPERLMPRVASRLGLARLNYLPYNHEQIGKVIRQRLKEADAEKVFAEDAIRLASLRVANNSGDVRKALQICRRAIEVREGPVVKAQDINRAQNDLYSSPFVAVMSHLSYLARLVLIALVKETETKNTGSVILRDVYYRFTNLAKTFAPAFQPRSLYYSDFQRVVSDLKQQSLVKVAKQTAASLASYQAEATRMSAETPDLSELNLYEANATRQSKKTTGTAKHKTIQKDNHADEDEDGANYLICLNELIEGTEVRKALIDEAGDRVAQRILL